MIFRFIMFLHKGSILVLSISMFLLLACDGQKHAQTGPISFKYGDQHPVRNVSFPDRLYYHNNGNVIDITKPPFNATGDGVTDDSDAFIDAYTMLIDDLKDYLKNYDTLGLGKPDYLPDSLTSKIIYIPEGNYLISKPIVYRGKVIQPRKRDHIEILINVRFIGANRDRTIIRLKDNSKSFSDGNATPVVSYGKLDFNNKVASNFFENLTINTGSGNPGAIGLRFHGANNAAVRNVAIISGDGQGRIGLYDPIGSGQGVYQNITIEGFDYGIVTNGSVATHHTFEYVTLKKQRKAGIKLGISSLSAKGVHSINAVPAALLSDSSSHMTLIEAVLEQGQLDSPAVNIESGTLFARDVRAEGYGNLVEQHNQVAYKDLNLVNREFVSDTVLSLFAQQDTTTLRLPPKDPPHIPWDNNFENWVSVHEYGAIGDGKRDDTEAIQQAMNAGKPIVYFEGDKYRITQTINVPEHVQHIHCMYSLFSIEPPLSDQEQPVFRIEGRGTSPILVEGYYSRVEQHIDRKFYLFDHASKRVLYLKDICVWQGRIYRNSVAGGEVFIEDVLSSTNRNETYFESSFIFKGQKVWARFIDNEHHFPPTPLYHVDDTDFWVLGFKHEGESTIVKNINGSRTEILGGIANAYGHNINDNTPMFYNNHSSLSFIVSETGKDELHSSFKTIVEASQKGEVRYLMCDDVPRRGGYKYKSTIPLYVGKKRPD